MKRIQILVILILLSVSAIAQNSFGVEMRTSRRMTFNSDKIVGGGFGFSTFGFSNFEVSEKGNPITTSYSIGLIYKLGLRSKIKLHFGKHQNGRIIDLTYFDDVSSHSYENVDIPYNYLQITPSFSYDITHNRVSTIVEIGLGINKKSIKEEDIFFIGINEYNFDIEIRYGINYQLMDMFEVGGNLVFSKALNNYELEDRILGHFNPYQFGLEINLNYYFFM